MEQEVVEHQELLYKILVVGDIGVGKTSFIKRYVHGIFSIHYKSTIGVDFALKVIQWDDNTNIRLQLWDIAGQERFGNMTRVYYKEAVGAIIVFDVTRSTTFDNVTKWKTDLDSKITLPDTDEPIPVILLANKIDSFVPDEDYPTWGKTPEEMNNFCETHGFKAWFETSAKDNKNIGIAVNKLVASILEKVKNQCKTIEPNIITLQPEPLPETKCCNIY